MAEVALALGWEAAFGYPQALYRRVGHPVQWIGALIQRLDEDLNLEREQDRIRRLKGVVAAALIAGCGALFGWGLERLCRRSPCPPLARALAATPGLAQRSLHEHVAAVERPLRHGDLKTARLCLSRIVGRDVAALDEAGIAAAALESLSESFNDGVVAPAFWFALGGLPALYAYKAVNTADSLIGHKEPRWRAFGWAAARSDDVLNLVPARLAGLLIAFVGGGGVRTMLRDAPRHASPNAGWPEAAMAGALEVELGGPATYDGVRMERPVFNVGGGPPQADDLARGLELYRRCCLLLAGGFLVLGVLRKRNA